MLAHDLTAHVAAAWGGVLLLLSLLVVPILDVLLLASLPRWLATPLPPPAPPHHAAEHATTITSSSHSPAAVVPTPLSATPVAAGPGRSGEQQRLGTRRTRRASGS